MIVDDTKELITSVRRNELEFPSEVSVTYSNIDNDYQIGTEYARRITAKHENKIVINLALGLTPAEAAKIADTALNSAWYTGRYTYSFSTNYSQLILSPGDIVTIPLETNQTETVKIISVDYGPTGMISYEAVPELTSLYTSNVSGTSGVTYNTQTVESSGPSKLEMLDCCMLRDSDTSLGWYVALSGYTTAWPGGIVLKSSDNGATWNQISANQKTNASIIGTTTTLLADTDCRVWDKTNTLTIRLNSGELFSSTEINVLNGANAALVGINGRWELIQWLTAVLNGDGTYTISNLLRGRKGTEFAASLHTISDSFIVLSTSTIKEATVTSSELNAVKQYKAVTSGNPIEDVTGTNYTYTGERLRPLSVINIKSELNSTGDITISWNRRDRIAKAWNSSSNLPMSESTEKYEIDIVFNSSTIRTLECISESVVYSAAYQVDDSLVPGNTITCNIYQISSVVGRGHLNNLNIIVSPVSTGTATPPGIVVTIPDIISTQPVSTYSAQPKVIDNISTIWNGTAVVATSAYESTGAYIWTSDSTGTTWTRQSSDINVGCTNLVYDGSSRYVGINLNYSKPYWSTTSTSISGPWTATDLYRGPPTPHPTLLNTLYDLVLYNSTTSKFTIVGCGGSTPQNAISSDGINWTTENQTSARTYSTGEPIKGIRIIWTGSTWLAVGFRHLTEVQIGFNRFQAKVWGSTDLLSWNSTLYTGADYSILRDIKKLSSTIITIGSSQTAYNSTTNALILRSTNNGTSWTNVTPATTLGLASELYTLHIIGTRFIAIGLNYTAYSDNDGITWTFISNLDNSYNSYNYGASGNDSTFIVMNTRSSNGQFTGLVRTTDGVTWTRVV